MIFFADEGLDVPLVVALRAQGLNVVHALETMRGADDANVLAAAVASNAVLLTKDKDFGEMVVRNAANSNGVVLIRIDDLKDARNLSLVVGLLLHHLEQLPGHFTVIQEDKIRLRKLE